MIRTALRKLIRWAQTDPKRPPLKLDDTGDIAFYRCTVGNVGPSDRAPHR